jgi:guanylate kinase
MKGRLVILSGPSGVGKDTLIDAWSEVNPRVTRVVTYTTREPRAGERDGVDYNFVSEERFQELAKAGAFYEHKLVHGNWYASPRADAEKYLAERRIVVLKIDVQGARSVMEERPDAESVFVLPPSMEELERRLRLRDSEPDSEVAIRLENARQEISQAGAYAHQIVNDDVQRAVSELEAIVAEPEDVDAL